jgi:hypothetical protein
MKAFPSQCNETIIDKSTKSVIEVAQNGMDLRDYFAAKALQGICASQPGLEWTNDFIAKEAYDIADEMMEARSK